MKLQLKVKAQTDLALAAAGTVITAAVTNRYNTYNFGGQKVQVPYCMHDVAYSIPPVP